MLAAHAPNAVALSIATRLTSAACAARAGANVAAAAATDTANETTLVVEIRTNLKGTLPMAGVLEERFEVIIMTLLVEEGLCASALSSTPTVPTLVIAIC